MNSIFQVLTLVLILSGCQFETEHRLIAKFNTTSEDFSIPQDVMMGIKTASDVFAWIPSHVHYNIPANYVWQTPGQTIHIGEGACKEYAVLACTMLRDINVKSSIVFTHIHGDPLFSHAVIRCNGRLVEPQTGAPYSGPVDSEKSLEEIREAFHMGYLFS